MALAREPRDTSQTLLAAHNSILNAATVATINTTTHSIAYGNITSRPSTATSITQAIAASGPHHHHQQNRSPRRSSYAYDHQQTNSQQQQRPTTSSSSTSLAPYPQPPFILGHAYATEWRSARQLEAARLKLVPKNLVKDTAGPMSYPLSGDGYEQLSTAKGRPFGGQVDGHYAHYAHDVATATGRVHAGGGATNADGTSNQQQPNSTSASSSSSLLKNIRGICTFGNTPRMISGDIHNEMCKSSGHRPTSATNRVKSPRSQLSEIEKKYGPLRLGMTDGTSLPGSSYRKVFVTPAGCEYDVRRAASLTRERSPRCSFGTCARFDGGSEASALCKPSSSRPSTANNQNSNNHGPSTTPRSKKVSPKNNNAGFGASASSNPLFSLI